MKQYKTVYSVNTLEKFYTPCGIKFDGYIRAEEFDDDINLIPWCCDKCKKEFDKGESEQIYVIIIENQSAN